MPTKKNTPVAQAFSNTFSMMPNIILATRPAFLLPEPPQLFASFLVLKVQTAVNGKDEQVVDRFEQNCHLSHSTDNIGAEHEMQNGIVSNSGKVSNAPKSEECCTGTNSLESHVPANKEKKLSKLVAFREAACIAIHTKTDG